MEKDYSASIIIVDGEGNLVYERELSADETIGELLKERELKASFAYRVKTDEEIEQEMKDAGVEIPEEDPIKKVIAKKTKKAARSCGKCGEPGHIARHCEQEPEESDLDGAEVVEEEDPGEWDGKARCKYSAEGIFKLKPRHPDRLGYIVGKARKGNALRVLWDTTKIPMNIHPDYIEQLPPGFVAREGFSKEDLKNEEIADQERREKKRRDDLQARIGRCVKGGMSAEEILDTPPFKNGDRREIEEMIAWAQRDNA